MIKAKASAGKRAALPLVPTAQRIRRGELWAVDFEPQSHREEPGKFGRPALVIQADSMNGAQHPSTIVIPGTSQTQQARKQMAVADDDELFPLRVRLPAGAQTGLRHTTDLLVDQVRAVSNRRLIKRLGEVDADTLARAEQALRWLTTG